MGNYDGSAVSWGKRLPHLCTRPGSNERRVCTPQHRDVSNRSEFLQIPQDRIDSRRVGTASLASTPHTLRAAQITTGGISLSRLDLRASAFISSTDTERRSSEVMERRRPLSPQQRTYSRPSSTSVLCQERSYWRKEA